MPRLLTIATPRVSANDAAFIEQLLNAHHSDRRVRAAHFTLVFGCSAIGVEAYIAHVSRVASSARPIDFECRYAMLGADDERDTAYVFLVPDTGFAQIALLHDRRYAGPLEAHLRLDLPYVPHITLGSTNDRAHAKSICDELNGRGLQIAGTIDALIIGALDEHGFGAITTCGLRG